MTERFTLGIEEEFQIVDHNTGQLSSCITTIMEKGTSIFGEQIKPEMLQPTVELISNVYPDIVTARREQQRLRGQLARLLAGEGLALISAGTHPRAALCNSTGNVRARVEKRSQSGGDRPDDRRLQVRGR